MSTATLPIRLPVPAGLLGVAAAGLIAAAVAASVPTDALTPALAPAPAPSPAAAIVPNAGQSPATVRFEARAGSATLFFTDREVVLAGAASTVRLRHEGAGATDVTPIGRQAGVVNVLRGSDPARWRAGLPTYAGVRYGELYPGIAVRHDVDAGGAPWVRSTYTVAPGADPAQIRWRYAGAGSVRVDANGSLRAPGALAASAPVAWQIVDGERRAVDAAYRVNADGTVGFDLGRHDRGHPLLVLAAPAGRRATRATPALAYATFLGGAHWDELYDIDVDASGNAWVTGITQSADFPTAGAVQPQFAGVQDVVVARFGSDGRLRYSTYLGGDATDAGHNIAVDRRGNAYVTGRTESEDFPTRGALRRPLNGRRCLGEPCHDAFVTKLDGGGGIVYSTYLGGTGNEEGVGIAVDANGRAHVSGNTDSDDFPVRNAVQPVNRSLDCEGDLPCPFDSYVARLNREGSALQFGTYLGGRLGELNGGVAVDAKGEIHVTGSTRSADFPTHRALQPRVKGVGCGPPPGIQCPDIYLVKLTSSGGAFRFSTYLGGTETERSGGVAVDSRGRSYLTGSTESPDFPTAHPVQKELDTRSCGKDEPLELCGDAFAAGIGADGQRLLFGTYLGGNAEDSGLGIAVDKGGTVHLAGSTDSRRFPTANALQERLAGGIDAFVARLAPGGRKLLLSTFMGGKEDERFNGIAADKSGATVVAGRSTSPDFPTANPAQRALAGDIDGVVARLR